MTSPIIDAHQHFWDPATGDYPWLAGPFEPIARVFGPEDLRPSLVSQGVSGTVLVQTWNDLGETRDYLRIAAETDFVAGVVGWVDLTDPKVSRTLAELKAGPLWQMAGGHSPSRPGRTRSELAAARGCPARPRGAG